MREGDPERDAAAGVPEPEPGAEANGVDDRERDREVGGEGRCDTVVGGARPSISAYSVKPQMAVGNQSCTGIVSGMKSVNANLSSAQSK